MNLIIRMLGFFVQIRYSKVWQQYNSRLYVHLYLHNTWLGHPYKVCNKGQIINLVKYDVTDITDYLFGVIKYDSYIYVLYNFINCTTLNIIEQYDSLRFKVTFDMENPFLYIIVTNNDFTLISKNEIYDFTQIKEPFKFPIILAWCCKYFISGKPFYYQNFHFQPFWCFIFLTLRSDLREYL